MRSVPRLLIFLLFREAPVRWRLCFYKGTVPLTQTHKSATSSSPLRCPHYNYSCFIKYTNYNLPLRFAFYRLFSLRLIVVFHNHSTHLLDQRTSPLPCPYHPTNRNLPGRSTNAIAYFFFLYFRSLHLDPRRKDPEAAIDKQLSHLKRGDHLLSVVTYCLHNVLADTLHPWKPLSACCDEKRPTSLLNPRRQTQILFDLCGGFPLKRRMRNTVHKIGYRDWCVVKLIHLVLSSPSDVTALKCMCLCGRANRHECEHVLTVLHLKGAVRSQTRHFRLFASALTNFCHLDLHCCSYE